MSKIFISPGDPAGIGPEITLKALSENKNIQNNFVLAGDKEFYQNLIDKYSLDVNLIDRKSKEKGGRADEGGREFPTSLPFSMGIKGIWGSRSH